MKYLLDTNACVAIINHRPPVVREQMEKAIARGDQITTSSIVVFELWNGVARSAIRETNTRKLEAFLNSVLTILPFDQEDAQAAGGVRAAAECEGKPLGAYDCLIAGQALRHDMTVVTANEREFGRVKGLSWKNWSRAPEA